ncbi:MAG: tetratricopeptide repeat protein, partial [Cyanothece sp. SIO2G6]|nr:tetratricopeptide repeat protein [Cyanothece sp. SIO2G6]
MVSITPDGQAVLTQLGIYPTSIRKIQPRSRRTHCRAIINWLSKYQPSTSASNLEQIRGYLEAFHHLCEIEEWERAAALIATELNTPTKECVHYQLKLWGHYQEQMNLYRALVDHLEPKENGMFTSFLGTTYYSQGNIVEAIEYFEKGLAIARTIGDRINEGTALSSLGGAYYSLGDYEQAIAYQEQWLV